LLGHFEGDGKFLVRAGHRRHAAAQKAGLKKVYVQPSAATNASEDLTTTYMENERKHFSLYERATTFKRLRDEGLKLGEIAKKLGLRQRFVQERLQFLSQAHEEMIAESMSTGERAVSDSNIMSIFLRSPKEPETQVETFRRQVRVGEMRIAKRKGTVDKDAVEKAKDDAARSRPGMNRVKSLAYLRQLSKAYIKVQRSREPLDEENDAWTSFCEIMRDVRKEERAGNLK